MNQLRCRELWKKIVEEEGEEEEEDEEGATIGQMDEGLRKVTPPPPLDLLKTDQLGNPALSGNYQFRIW